MARIKYMGSADKATLKKGEDFGGRVTDGITSEVVFNQGNNWVVDTEEAGLSPEQVEALLEDETRFKDVTDLKRIPSNLNQRTFLGHKKTTENESLPDEAEPQGQEGVEPGGSLVAGAGADVTTVGGSTAGDAGTPAATTTTGGSTGRGGRKGSTT